jgi:hypothetical protein
MVKLPTLRLEHLEESSQLRILQKGDLPEAFDICLVAQVHDI